MPAVVLWISEPPIMICVALGDGSCKEEIRTEFPRALYKWWGEEPLASKPRSDLPEAEKERKNKQKHGEIQQLAQQFVGWSANALTVEYDREIYKLNLYVCLAMICLMLLS